MAKSAEAALRKAVKPAPAGAAMSLRRRTWRRPAFSPDGEPELGRAGLGHATPGWESLVLLQ